MSVGDADIGCRARVVFGVYTPFNVKSIADMTSPLPLPERSVGGEVRLTWRHLWKRIEKIVYLPICKPLVYQFDSC
jgi:hypothetical protein